MREQSIKQLVESEGPQVAAMQLCELVEEKKLKLGNFETPGQISIGELYEAFVGRERLQMAYQRRGYVEMPLREDAAVGVSMFSNITGVLLGNEIIEAYELASKIGDALVADYPTKLRDERLPGFQRNGDVKEVKEGDAYDRVGISDKYITLGTALKKGCILDVTEEVVYYDQTGKLLDECKEIGEDIAYEKEEIILKAVTGVTACYYPSGASEDLYQAAPYLVASNALVDWTSIETSLLTGFAAMTKEDGKRINVVPNALLVPSDLLFTAKRIVGATEILGKTPMTGTAGTTAQARETKGQNVVDNYQIISSHRVSAVQTSNGTTNWWLGDFKRQFRWKRVWDVQVFTRPANSEQQFERDIVAGFKVRYLGNVFAKDKRYVIKNTA